MRKGRHVRGGRLWAVVVICTGALRAFTTRAAPQNLQQAPTSLGAITGSVSDAATGRAVAGAVVTLKDSRSGSPFAEQHQVSTPTGRFAFLDLPAAVTYTLTARKTGWLDGGYQRADPRGPAAPIGLADGQWLADVHVTLTPPGSISGIVMDERGEPLVNAPVRVLAQALLAGQPQWLVGPAARTDDRGAYRIGDLGPGRYVVELPSIQATLPAGWTNPRRQGFAVAATSQADLAEAVAANRAEKLVVDVGGVWHLVVGAYAVPPAPTADGARRGYPLVFAPDASTPDAAGAIELRMGESRPDVDFHLRPERVSRVSGLVQGPPEAVGHFPLRLIPIGLEELGQGSEAATTETQSDGRFTFLDVPSGRYVLDASHARVDYTYTARDDARTAVPSPVPFLAASAAGGSVQAARPGIEYSTLQDGASVQYWGQIDVGVNGQDVAGIVLTLRPPVTISGRVEWAPGVTPRSSPPLVLEPADGRRSLGVPHGLEDAGPAAAERHAFEIAGVMAGQYFLRPMFGASVVTMTCNGLDCTNRPLDTTAGADLSNIVLTLTTASSSVSGMVGEGVGSSHSGVAVIAFPVQHELWSNYGLNPPWLKSVLSTADGRFRLDGLPAGDYNLEAVPADEERAWLDPRFLASHEGQATHVRVDSAGASVANVSLSVVK